MDTRVAIRLGILFAPSTSLSLLVGVVVLLLVVDDDDDDGDDDDDDDHDHDDDDARTADLQTSFPIFCATVHLQLLPQPHEEHQCAYPTYTRRFHLRFGYWVMMGRQKNIIPTYPYHHHTGHELPPFGKPFLST